MSAVDSLIQGSVLIAWVTLVVAFAILAKSAHIFVDGAVGVANKLGIPKLIIGIFLVSVATTAPELVVSLISALRGNPEVALGNAIGSVIVDDSLALGLAGVLAVSPILVIPHVLRTAGAFLIFTQGLLFLFVIGDYTLQRWEGMVLVALFFVYLTYVFIQHRKGIFRDDIDLEAAEKGESQAFALLIGLFVIGVGGLLISGHLVVTSAITIARSMGIPESIIALTIIALGTSIPEIATCITAARKGQGAIAVGNILGADILNICWIAGASAIANDLILTRQDVMLMFPWMFVIVGAMLLMLWKNYRLTRKKGIVLLLLYVAYLASFIVMLPRL